MYQANRFKVDQVAYKNNGISKVPTSVHSSSGKFEKKKQGYIIFYGKQRKLEYNSERKVLSSGYRRMVQSSYVHVLHIST